MAPLLEIARPLHWGWQNSSVGNVATLPKFDNFPLTLLFSDDCKRRVGKVHVALCSCLEPAGPANQIDEAALVAIVIGNTERVDEAVLEGRKSHA